MGTSTASTSQSSPIIRDGTCYVYFAFDVGITIDLDQCAKLVSEPRESTRLQHKQKTPKYFDYTPLPLRISQRAGSFCFTEHDYCTRQSVDVTIFDFGAISVCYRIDLNGPLDQIVGLSEMLYENEQLRTDARERALHITNELRSAIHKPSINELSEDYLVFEIRSFVEPCTEYELTTTHRDILGKILRSDDQNISPQQVEEALASRVSYTKDDVAILDWGAAFLFGDKMDDVRAVLEFANVELLEMRYQDAELDQGLETAYRVLNEGRSFRKELNTIAQLQVDSAMMYEGVNNALKLLGDQYLARVYSHISKRFHLSDWDTSILRKLETLDSIYSKLSDQVATKRSLILEIIVVVLISAEIVLSLVGH